MLPQTSFRPHTADIDLSDLKFSGSLSSEFYINEH